MKILMINPFYYPAIKYGGPIFCQYDLDIALVKENVIVDVLSTDGGLEDSSLVHGTWYDYNGIRIKRFKYFGYEHFTFSPGIFFESLNIASNYDLIHISGVWNFPTLAGSISGLVNNVPYVITPHGTLNKNSVSLKSKDKKFLYYNMIANHCLNRASAIHFTTKDERDNVLSLFNIKARHIIVPNGINLKSYLNLPQNGFFIENHEELIGKKYIIFLGRITRIKGLDILAQAFGRISQTHPDIYLVIAGPDNEGLIQNLKPILASNLVLDKTIFTGMLSDKMRIASLVDSSVFVLPSYSENFGMAVVEAMACGAPVVISNNVGIYREVQERNAGIVVEATPDSIYHGVVALLDNQQLRGEVVSNAKRMLSELYDISNVANTMIEEYLSIIHSYKNRG